MKNKELLQKALNKEPQRQQQQSMEETSAPIPAPAPAPAPAPKILTPNEFVMNPLLSVYTAIDDLSLDVDDLKKSNKTNEELLRAILDRDTRMLDLQLEEADEGGVFRKRGLALTTKFFFVNAFNEIGHFAKGYTVKNDGPNTIFVAHNAPFNPEVDVDPIDISSQQSRFEEVLSGEPVRFSFNRRKIESVHVISDPSTGKGPSNVRIWLVW